MLSFQNDYQEGAHEKILKRLMETNLDRSLAMVPIPIQRVQRKRSERSVNAHRRMCGS